MELHAGMARKEDDMQKGRITIAITIEADFMSDAHDAVDEMDLALRAKGGKVIKARFVRDSYAEVKVAK